MGNGRTDGGRPSPAGIAAPGEVPADAQAGTLGARRTREVHSAISSFFGETARPRPDGDGDGSGAIDQDLRAIANRVRRWREEAGLTLQELARRSGVAGSTIQKVESLQMIPTLGVMLKIARGLDRAPSDLVRDGGDDLAAVLLRADERHTVGVPDAAVFERMVGDLFDPQLEAWRIRLEPGHGSGRGLVRFDGEGLLFCEHGEVTVRLGDEKHVLRVGDVLHYKATVPHGWRNLGEEPAQVLIVGTLARALRSALHRRMREGGDGTD